MESIQQGDRGDEGSSNPPSKSSTTETENAHDSTVCNFFRKSVKNKNIRRRPSAGEDEDEDDDSKLPESSLRPPKKKSLITDNKLHFRTEASKRLTAADPNDELKTSVFHFDSTKEIQVQHDSRATATLETETEFCKDNRAIRERMHKQAMEDLKGYKHGTGDDRLYRGIHGYTDYRAGFRREHTVSSEKAGGAHGPLRASAHIKVSTRFDYQPDLCKDYKETGYCGYGDACKFMHDRGDYKSGWQLEKEWDEAEKARKMKLATKGDDGEEVEQSDDEDDSLPFACFICRQPFVDAVVTKCKHYFCEHCALRHHAKSKKCFVCNQPTNGIFNTAFEIRRKMASEGR